MAVRADRTTATHPALDDLMTISELSSDMLRMMATRIEGSHTVEQIVYRETELDEVWRLTDIALSDLGARKGSHHRAEAEQLAAVAELVYAAHDLIGQNEDIRGAASALRKAAVLAASLPDASGE